jgi:hypothetical protein
MMQFAGPTFRLKQTLPILAGDWRGALLGSALLVTILGIAAVHSGGSLTGFFFFRQDLTIGLVAAALFIFLAVSTSGETATPRALPALRTLVGIGVCGLIFGGWVGHYVVMKGYALSRDEQMALHDAAIFANGQFAAPLPSAWHEMSAALNRNFIADAYGPNWTVSAYRPINALFHMLMSKIGLVHFTAPIMSAIGLVATWRVVKRLWPNDVQVHSLSILFYLCSVQVWAASMTSYAMNTLLALNMVWLAFFLRRDALGYGIALFSGFLAVGIHQVPHHPMFAAPFIALLFVERRLLPAFLFAGSYASFILFWTQYEDFAAILMGIGLVDQGADNITATMFGKFSAERMLEAAGFTAANMLRFFAWQHLLLLPLILVAGKAAIRDRNLLLIAMIAAFLLPPLIKLIQVPYQGHGWGYRYVHGAIGLTCILAAVGWRELSRQRLATPRGLTLATALTICLAFPWQLSNAYRFSAGYAQVDRQLSSATTDFVIVDTRATPFGDDLVNNRADLSNRPLRLIAGHILPAYVPELCRRGSVTLFPTENLEIINRHWGLATASTPEYQAVMDGFRKQCPNKLNEVAQP